MANSKGSGYTPTEFQPAKYQLAGGVDTKVHGLVLPPPKLQTCQNAYADRTGSLSRRFGRSLLASTDRDGAAITGWRATAAYQGRLIGFTGKKVYDYSAGAGRWADGKRATSWRVRSTTLDAGDAITGALAFPVGGCRDMAVSLSGYRLYAYDYYETRGAAIFTRTAIVLLDPVGTRLASNLVLSQNSAVAGSISSVRVVAHGSRFYVVYGDAAGLGALKCFIVDLTSAATIATSLAASPTTLAGDLLHGSITPLDVCDDIWHGPFVCYTSTTANTIKTGFITTAGALTATNSISSGAADAATISCDSISTGANTALMGVAFGLSTHPNDIYAALRSYNGSAWTSVATSGAMDTALAASQNRAIVCKFDSVTTLRVFFDNDLHTTAQSIRQATFTTAGVIAPRVARLNRSYLASKPFFDPDGQMMVWVSNDSITVQPTAFLMTITGIVAGVALQGDFAVELSAQPWGLGHVVSDAGGTSFSMFCQSFVRFGTNGVGATVAWRDITIDTAHDQAYATVQDGCLLIPNSVLLQYDGISCTEVGFLQYVETASIVPVPSNGAGLLTNSATYGIRIVPEWTNAQGEREQGTDNGPVTVVLGAADDTLTYAVPTIPWTLKQYSAITDVVRPNLVFAFYRTLPSPTGDSPHFRCGTVANDPTADTVTFVDLMSDAVLATQEQLKDDTELDGTTPAAGYILAAGNGRVVIAGLPDDPNLAMYSKTRGHGEPLTFSDALTIPIPTSTGAITAVAMQNDSIVFFTERAIYRVHGPGLNNTGTAGGFTDPILVTTDDGAVGPRGVIATPGGVMFDSTARGICILTPSFSSEYIGAPLEKLADPGTCTGTAILPALQQVRFSFASVTYVYDYFHGQWYTFTHGSTGPTSVWNQALAAVDANGVVYDDPTAWTDDGTPYTMELKLGWLTSGSTLLANLRVRSLGLVGQSLAAHNLAINLGYDQAAATELLETAVAGAGPLAAQWRLSQQRCYAIEVTIRDAKLDVYLADVVQNTAGMRLNELAFEVGLVNPRLNRYNQGAPGGGNDGPIGI